MKDLVNMADLIQETSPRGVLVGFVLVAEWASEDGRWLSRLDGTPDGSVLPDWQRQGYLHNALHEVWDSVPEE